MEAVDNTAAALAARQAVLKERMRSAVLSIPDLSDAEHRVLLALVHIWQFRGLFPKQDTIGAVARYSDRHVRTALAKLRLRALITWEKRRYAGNQTSNLYRFTAAFWELVRERSGSSQGFRRQSEQASAGSRKPVPAKGSLPENASSKREGEGRAPAPAREDTPPPSVGDAPPEGAAELRELFRSERATKYPHDPDAGGMRAEREQATAAALDGLAVEGVSWAGRNGMRRELPDVRRELARMTIALWLAHPGSVTEAEPGGVLAARGHKYGLFAGDVGRFGRMALDAWKRRQRAKVAAELPPVPERRRPGWDAVPRTFRVPTFVRRSAA